jgi:site-specific DNA-cytosine methylase
VYDPDGISCQLTAQGGGLGAKTGLYEISTAQPRCGNPNIVNRVRKLTPTECERLQGFPDDWTAGISDTQRYKCCGNAVSVIVVKEIAERLK